MLQKYQFAILCGLTLLCVTNADAKAAPMSALTMSAQDKQHLFFDKFTLVTKVHSLPKPIVNTLTGTDPLSGMADAGQPYSVTDVVSATHPLPFRRLIFGGVSPGYCLVYNERGGIAYGTVASWYRVAHGSAKLIWQATIREANPSKTLSELRAKIRSGQFYSSHGN